MIKLTVSLASTPPALCPTDLQSEPALVYSEVVVDHRFSRH